MLKLSVTTPDKRKARACYALNCHMPRWSWTVRPPRPSLRLLSKLHSLACLGEEAHRGEGTTRGGLVVRRR